MSYTGKSNDEQRLAEQIRNGDNGAMQTFCSLYVPHLKAVCTRYIVDQEDARDVLQETLICIITHITDFKYRGAGSLQAWATRIAVNVALNFIRNNHQYELTFLRQRVEDVVEEEDPPIEDIPPEAIQQMVRQLPTGYRTVLNLYVFEDKSHEEIARLLGINVNTSTSQLRKAKNMLAKMIQAYHDDKQPPR